MSNSEYLPTDMVSITIDQINNLTFEVLKSQSAPFIKIILSKYADYIAKSEIKGFDGRDLEVARHVVNLLSEELRRLSDSITES